MKRILICRFSAMGDVIMLLPVVKGLLDSNPKLEIHLLTRPNFFPVFAGIDRLHLVQADLKKQHKGLFGLYRLYRKIKREVKPNQVFDLHDVLRTKILRTFFRIGGTKVQVFQKGRSEKKHAVESKHLKMLPSTIDRYAAAFSAAGYRFILPKPNLYAESNREELFNLLKLEDPKVKLIGIAPFAKHQQKVWGADKVDELLGLVQQVPDLRVVLFGGGKEELDVLEELAAKHDHCLVAAHYLNLTTEVQLMQHLELMLSMDSANMHMAAMAGIPVVSVWGATHPSLGFAPFHQPKANCIQYEGPDLDCRPCSVFGNKKCIYGDVRCMKRIPVNQVAERIGFLLDHPIHQFHPHHA